MTDRVLVVEDDGVLRNALCQTLGMSGYSVVAAEDGEAAWAELNGGRFGLVVSDVQMGPMDGLTLLRRIRQSQPDIPVLLMTAFASIEQAVGAMREGAADYLVKPFEAQVLVKKVSDLLDDTVIENDDEPIAVDPTSRELFDLARRIASSDVTSVMITGESGTGKEVVGRYIHRHSPRCHGPFVAINCAAIPENMLEAMLFGYEKGAFTGAHKSSPGKFEQAQAGTLLLDEITEMPLALQAKLLRVLQEREVERLGGKETISLDVRVLATSNRDLRLAVTEGEFREDLFYRLNVFSLECPTLRERPGDIVPLAEHLLRTHATEQSRQPPRLSGTACERISAHRWPGNVRELDNTIQRALVLYRGDCIEPEDLGLSNDTLYRDAPIDKSAHDDSLGGELRAQEFRMIRDALVQHKGSRKAVADSLGVSPRTLRYKIARMREAGMSIPD